MAVKPTDAELDMLTDEERAGLEDEDMVDEGLEEGAAGEESLDGDAAEAVAAALVAAAAEKKPDVVVDEDLELANGDGTQRQAAKPDEAAAAGAAAAAAEGDGQGWQPATPPAVVEERRPSWVLDPAVPEKLKSLDEERDRIIAQFDDGEMTGAEMRAKLKPLESQIDEIKTTVISANVAKTNAIDHYKDVTVPAFFEKHVEYQPGTILHTMLDAEVRRLQQTSNNPLNPAILEKAHENITSQVEKAYGVKKAAPKAEAKTPAAAAARQVPPTLGGVPSADVSDTDDGGEFAWLDRLASADTEKFETELAKLSDEKRERYMAE
ncbi:hypothetical protein RU07_20670 [Agrobacterium tumefaciens]|uniref:Uncharacterized protein n=1 Tax=Agrobacterium tumefaciens TaxID=358 RepID=A0A0D0KQA0_AGRTU|nr:hypothetical protein RU07_20670 [Agrobacterium tumefaciens]